MPHVEPSMGGAHSVGHRGDGNEYSKVLSARVLWRVWKASRLHMCLQYLRYGYRTVDRTQIFMASILYRTLRTRGRCSHMHSRVSALAAHPVTLRRISACVQHGAQVTRPRGGQRETRPGSAACRAAKITTWEYRHSLHSRIHPCRSTEPQTASRPLQSRPFFAGGAAQPRNECYNVG